MDEHLRRAGYREGQDWITLRFDGAEHNEAAWRARLDVPVRFLLRGLGAYPYRALPRVGCGRCR